MAAHCRMGIWCPVQDAALRAIATDACVCLPRGIESNEFTFFFLINNSFLYLRTFCLSFFSPFLFRLSPDTLDVKYELLGAERPHDMRLQ